MSNKVYFSNKQKTVAVPSSLKTLVKKAVNATLSFEDFHRDVLVSVSFVDNDGIRRLNRQYRNVDRETDVLSFPMYSFSPDDQPLGFGEVELGDIVISLERALFQATEYGHSFEREVAFLAVHSMLHLLGYDHELSEEDDLLMRKKQHEILDLMGLHRTGELAK